MVLTIAVREHGNISVVEMEGRLVFEECQRVRETVKKLLAQGKRKIVLDLEQVSHCDSAGLGCLASSFASVNNMEGALKLASPTPKVREVLALTRLDSVIEVLPSKQAAVASFE